MFAFPTSKKPDASFSFTSFPDLFNWNVKYPQPGWEEAMDWFLGGMKKEGPAFSLNAGDIMDARWWSTKEQVRRQTEKYWGGFKKRFEEKGIRLYIAPGDHEYGDDKGLKKMDLVPVYAEQFSSIFDLPRNGPEHKKGRAYSFAKENLAVISVDTFEDAGDHMSMTVSGKQLEWLKGQLQRYRDKDFIIVQGHVPVVGPVKSKNSSANMLEGGRDSPFWQTMVEYGVDVYFAGEHHRVTTHLRDGIWQVVHGALWGTQEDVNYLRGSVYPDRLELELFRFWVEYGGKKLTDQHPNRGENGGPWGKVSITESARKKGPSSIGRLVIESGRDGNETTVRTGVFETLKESLGVSVQSQEGWHVVAADSVSEFNGKLPENAIDGEPATHWHTEWKQNKPDHPHSIVIDMGEVRTIGGFVYVPRQDDSKNGIITKYQFFVSGTAEELGSPVKAGTFGTFGASHDPKVVTFDQPVTGRYLKLKSLASAGHGNYASAAELWTIKP